MSTNPFPIDPYRPPPEILADPVLHRRPGGLTAVCIIAMILGGLGLLTGLIQVGTLAGGKQFANAINLQSQARMTPEQVKIQNEMQDAANAVTDQFFVAGVVQALVHFTVAGTLIAGGILAFRLKPLGRKLLLGVCILAIVYEGGRTVLVTMVQMRTITIMETYLPKMIAAGPQGGQPAQLQEATKLGMKIGMVIGIVFTSILALVKVAFYVVTLLYLNRRNVKPLFDEPILAT